MQKKLIALAVAGLASSAAFAQSNVTIYGVADVYAGYASATGNASKTVINSGGLSSSRLGFKGTEDLGNGLKALFTLEYGLSVDDASGVGSGTATARQQFVGLTSASFGTLVAGRLQTAGYDFSAATNALHGTAINPLSGSGGVTRGFAANGVPALNGEGTLIGASSRASNAFAYISPEFYGVTFAYNHARLSEAAASSPAPAFGKSESDGTANLYSVTYKNGPLVVSGIGAVATLTPNVIGAVPNNNNVKLSEYALGAGYDFGVVNLKGSYQRQKIQDAGGDDTAWQLSAIVPVTTAGKVVVGYAKNTIESDKLATGENPSNNSKSWSVAYLHSLSKRTTLYTGFQSVTNDSDNVNGGANLGTALKTDPVSNPAWEGGGSAKAFVFGMNHSF